jgi:hypothetical protein
VKNLTFFLSMLPAWEIVIIALLSCIACLISCIVLMALALCGWFVFHYIASYLCPLPPPRVP